MSKPAGAATRKGSGSRAACMQEQPRERNLGRGEWARAILPAPGSTKSRTRIGDAPCRKTWNRTPHSANALSRADAKATADQIGNTPEERGTKNAVRTVQERVGNEVDRGTRLSCRAGTNSPETRAWTCLCLTPSERSVYARLPPLRLSIPTCPCSPLTCAPGPSRLHGDGQHRMSAEGRDSGVPSRPLQRPV